MWNLYASFAKCFEYCCLQTTLINTRKELQHPSINKAYFWLGLRPYPFFTFHFSFHMFATNVIRTTYALCRRLPFFGIDFLFPHLPISENFHVAEQSKYSKGMLIALSSLLNTIFTQVSYQRLILKASRQTNRIDCTIDLIIMVTFYLL